MQCREIDRKSNCRQTAASYAITGLGSSDPVWERQHALTISYYVSSIPHATCHAATQLPVHLSIPDYDQLHMHPAHITRHLVIPTSLNTKQVHLSVAQLHVGFKESAHTAIMPP